MSTLLGYVAKDRKISLRHPDCSDMIVYIVEGSYGEMYALLGAIESEDELSRVFVVREFADFLRL